MAHILQDIARIMRATLANIASDNDINANILHRFYRRKEHERYTTLHTTSTSYHIIFDGVRGVAYIELKGLYKLIYIHSTQLM